MGRAARNAAARVVAGLLLLPAGLARPFGLDGAPLRLADVPFLPQSGQMCGGATLAMVLRYWGAAHARPEEFAGALTADGRGIPTDAMAGLAQEHGYRAVAFQGNPDDVQAHLMQGRPVIALLEVRPGRYHYVVVLAWANGRILFHDPARGPLRTMSEAEWLRRWDATHRWGLLILPPAVPAPAAAAPADSPTASSDSCAALVQPAVALARGGQIEAARAQLVDAAASCPESPAPWRELAGLEFTRKNWPEAARAASAAVQRDRTDVSAWRVLATSRFLDNQPDAALAAWNAIGEPRLDDARIDGLGRTPYLSIHRYLDEPGGALLTPATLRRARRRLELLAAVQTSAVRYRPQSDGWAQLQASVVERPVLEAPKLLLAQSAASSVFSHGLSLNLVNLTAAGDAAQASWRWESHRPQVALALSTPHALGLPGIVTADLLWDVQTYRGVAPAAGAQGDLRETRRRAGLTLDNWWTADTRASVSLAIDEWAERGRELTLSTKIERRLWADKAGVGGSVSGWWGDGRPFYAGSAWMSVRSTTRPRDRAGVRLDLSYDSASENSPLALWSGAGTGIGRSRLLRAHRLIQDGILSGATFGRQLVRGGVEGELPVAALGPVKLGIAAFVDAARAWDGAVGANPIAAVDLGTGLRVRIPGRRAALRLDVATPLAGGGLRVSGGWQAQWPQ